MAEQQQHFVFSDAHTTLEEDRITQQQGSANAHPSTSYGEPPPVYGHDGVALQLVPNTQQWGFNYDTAWGGYQPGASAQYDTMVPPIDYRAMNTGMFTDVFDPNFQAGRVDPTAHAVQLKAAYASAPTSVHPNWQVPSYLPVQQLRHQYHSQAPVLTPHDQLPYMYPSQLLGQPGAALPHQPQFTTPIQGRDIPEPERTPTGSTNVEPQVVFDETGRSYQAYREGKYFLPNDGVKSTSNEHNSRLY